MPTVEAPVAAHPASNRLRTWLIIVTIVAALGSLAAIPATLFGTYMAAFAADDPSASTDAVWNIMVTVWAVGAGFVILLIAGVAGGWLAYRKRRTRLSFGLSLLAAAPIALVLLAVVALVLVNAIWTASL